MLLEALGGVVSVSLLLCIVHGVAQGSDSKTTVATTSLIPCHPSRKGNTVLKICASVVILDKEAFRRRHSAVPKDYQRSSLHVYIVRPVLTRDFYRTKCSFITSGNL